MCSCNCLVSVHKPKDCQQHSEQKRIQSIIDKIVTATSVLL